MPFTVILYGHHAYEPGDVLVYRFEAESPEDAVRLAREDERTRRYDAVFPSAVFAGWLDNLLAAGTGLPPARGKEDC
jgi:hypothetical protein